MLLHICLILSFVKLIPCAENDPQSVVRHIYVAQHRGKPVPQSQRRDGFVKPYSYIIDETFEQRPLRNKWR